MIWDKPMMAYGTTLQPDQLQAAWDSWAQRLPRPAYWLESLVSDYVPASRDPVAMRIADRMIQKARKAGAIRFVNGKWEKVQ